MLACFVLVHIHSPCTEARWNVSRTRRHTFCNLSWNNEKWNGWARIFNSEDKLLLSWRKRVSFDYIVVILLKVLHRRSKTDLFYSSFLRSWKFIVTISILEISRLSVDGRRRRKRFPNEVSQTFWRLSVNLGIVSVYSSDGSDILEYKTMLWVVILNIDSLNIVHKKCNLDKLNFNPINEEKFH